MQCLIGSCMVVNRCVIKGLHCDWSNNHETKQIAILIRIWGGGRFLVFEVNSSNFSINHAFNMYILKHVQMINTFQIELIQVSNIQMYPYTALIILTIMT